MLIFIVHKHLFLKTLQLLKEKCSLPLCMAETTVFTVIQLQAEEEHSCSSVAMGLAEAVLWVHCCTLNSLENLCLDSCA